MVTEDDSSLNKGKGSKPSFGIDLSELLGTTQGKKEAISQKYGRDLKRAPNQGVRKEIKAKIRREQEMADKDLVESFLEKKLNRKEPPSKDRR